MNLSTLKMLSKANNEAMEVVKENLDLFSQYEETMKLYFETKTAYEHLENVRVELESVQNSDIGLMFYDGIGTSHFHDTKWVKRCKDVLNSLPIERLDDFYEAFMDEVREWYDLAKMGVEDEVNKVQVAKASEIYYRRKWGVK